jgi:hypothetical protein
MTIRAKYQGKCNRCGGVIRVGEEIEWSRSAGASHVKCAANSEPIPTDAIKIGGGSGYGCQPYTVGQVIHRKTHGYITILSASSRYIRDDGMSFGVGDGQGYIYSAACRLATDEESAPLRAEEQKRTNRQIAKKRIAEIAETIRTTGEYPQEVEIAEGEEIVIDDSSRIYGGGDWFVIGTDYIWYVRNNGMDGDNWGNNNVRTGGAGAIGYRLAYTAELDQQIRRAIHCRETGEAIDPTPDPEPTPTNTDPAPDTTPTEPAPTIPETILEQLGGNKFITMTGAKNIAGGNDHLSFKIGRNKAGFTHCKIRHTSLDIYNFTFYKIRKCQIVVEQIRDMVYADQLKEVFESETGMAVSL